ncbi:MAG: DUF1963 domain-containing protein [Pseudomonadota bacterium]
MAEGIERRIRGLRAFDRGLQYQARACLTAQATSTAQWSAATEGSVIKSEGGAPPRDEGALREALIGAGLADIDIAPLMDEALPAAILLREPVPSDAIPTGASKFGGAPDLPDHLSWPERPAIEDLERFTEIHHFRAQRAREHSKRQNLTGYLSREAAELEAHAHARRAADAARPFPLAFVCQVDLAELRAAVLLDAELRAGLPLSGRLLFFYDFWQDPPGYDPASAVCWRVVHDPSPRETLTRRAPPARLREVDEIDRHMGILAPMKISFAPAFMPPVLEDLQFPVEEVSERGLDRYMGWADAIMPHWTDRPHNHQFGGRARFCQGTAQTSSQLAFHGIYAGRGIPDSARQMADDAYTWRCLLQLGTDSFLGQCQMGMLVFLMREEDVRAGRWQNVWADYSCD